MNRLKITSLFTAITLVSAIVVTHSVSADVTTKSDANQFANVAVKESAVLARDTSNLRCWQYGELLFEETHLSEEKLGSTDNMLVFQGGSDDDKKRQIYLINAGSATCLYKKI